MLRSRRSPILAATMAFALAMLLTIPANAQTLTILEDFLRSGTLGYSPENGLIFDSSGNLYGATGNGGAYLYGTVFELAHTAGGYTPTVLHNFDPNSKIDGSGPNGLLMDSAGNLYGTTNNGPKTFSDIDDNGLAYELLRQSDGSFSEKILYVFKGYNKNYRDGTLPWGNLIFDSAGNLYGSTRYGGEYNWGTVFELSPSGGGSWTEKILYSFDKRGDGGCQAFGGLVFDAAGNLYGTTNECGANGDGTVYELSQSGGVWRETVLHAFSNSTTDGAYPNSGVVFDSAGNLYGTTYNGGEHGVGVVYEVSPGGGGTWTTSTLHSFGAVGDGSYPFYVPTLDANGNLYGTTTQGGNAGAGVIWELSPGSGGVWTESVLFLFSTTGENYNIPSSGVILDSQGNLYGEVSYGGSQDGGGAYELTP